MKPFFLPIKLISFEAIIEPIAIPMMEIDIGKVAKDFIGLIWDPIIPLKKTVTGAAVKLKTWLINKTKRFLFIQKWISTLTFIMLYARLYNSTKFIFLELLGSN